jgi:hypothetical protein
MNAETIEINQKPLEPKGDIMKEQVIKEVETTMRALSLTPVRDEFDCLDSKESYVPFYTEYVLQRVLREKEIYTSSFRATIYSNSCDSVRLQVLTEKYEPKVLEILDKFENYPILYAREHSFTIFSPIENLQIEQMINELAEVSEFEYDEEFMTYYFELSE